MEGLGGSWEALEKAGKISEGDGRALQGARSPFGRSECCGSISHHPLCGLYPKTIFSLTYVMQYLINIILAVNLTITVGI